MGVRSGEEWGEIRPAPAGVVRVADDRALHQLVNERRESGSALPPVAPASGDLLRAVGGSGDPARLDGVMAVLPVDVVRVEAAGERAWFVTHLVARRRWWTGRVVAVMNGQYRGAWDVAPRAHPGDGLVDLVVAEATMGTRDRWSARRRLEHGLHLPHPSISVQRSAATTVRCESRARLWLDGQRWIRADEVTVTVEPDGLLVCV